MTDAIPRKILAVCFYKQENGKEPVREWLKSLSKTERRVLGEDIKIVQEGWPLGMPLISNLGKGLWEIRCRLPNTIARILFIMHDSTMVLLHGFIKKTQKTLQQDLEIAFKRAKKVGR